MQAVPYVMEAIELLFAAWFIQCEDFICAQDALQLFALVRSHEESLALKVSI